jgi:hypothetical protein
MVAFFFRKLLTKSNNIIKNIRKIMPRFLKLLPLKKNLISFNSLLPGAGSERGPRTDGEGG